MSSVLLSPLDLIGARRISYTSVTGSLDAGYSNADSEPHPRTPTRHLSTLSVLSSPFGSPSGRVGMGVVGDDGVPTASALFSSRYGAFPSALALEEARHSRGDSVDSQLFTHEESEEDEGGSEDAGADRDADDGDVAGAQSRFDDAVAGVEIHVQRESMASESLRVDHVLEHGGDSSSFTAADASDYLAVDDDLLRVGESDDSRTSLYDQYYTPTVHSSRVVADLDAEEGQEASPTMVLRSVSQDLDQELSSPIRLPYV